MDSTCIYITKNSETGTHTRITDVWGWEISKVIVNGVRWVPQSDCDHIFDPVKVRLFGTHAVCAKCGEHR